MSPRRETPSLAGGHVPVMLAEVLDVLAPRDGGIYVDGTFGAGGYSRAILQAADCTVCAFDRDPGAIAAGAALADDFSDRLILIEGRFGDMARLLAERSVERVNGVALDLGVSSMQLDQAERGFSFMSDGPLSMSMEQSGPSAAEAVNGLSEAELARIIARYGEEKRARQVARAIVAARREAPITRTAELAAIVCQVVRPSRDGLHPATRTFQALRVHVNDELGELERGLRAAEEVLAPDGRLAVVAFQSLEDARVKAFLRERSGDLPGPSRHEPLPAADKRPAPTFETLSRKALKPSEAESAQNPRARSARLRAARRTAAPSWPPPSGPSRGSGDTQGAAA